jgi:UPF0755 protein
MSNQIINHKQQPINGQPSGLKIPKKILTEKILLWIGGSVVALIIILLVGVFAWYNIQLSPIGNDKGELKKITVAKNSTSSQIGKQLQDQKLIRSSYIFDIYVRLSGKGSSLQAGTYRLSPADSTPEIIDHFTKGLVDEFQITFYPGATLTDSSSKPAKNKQDVTSVLKKAGYSDSEISTALEKTYGGPLFVDKPSNADLEGYIYGDTYSVGDGATVEDILQRTFDEFYKVVQDNNLVASFANHGLNLYQGITLASIIQREANSASDQKQVAQVFYSRLALDMPLGSDVTYQYIADKTGVARNPNLNNPYNTRRFAGLPPGPIAVPGLSALKAVANPASGDYLYFLSGDDNVTYFARTDVEHEANIVNHCKIKCSTP